MDPERESRLEKGARHPRHERSLSLDSEEEGHQRRRKKEREMANRDSGMSRRREEGGRDKYEDGGRGGSERERGRGYDDGRRNKHDDRERKDYGKRGKEEGSGRDRGYDRDTQRRRSRSPDSRRRDGDRNTRNRRSADRSPHRSSKDKEVRSSREGSAAQVTRKSKGPLPSQAASFQRTDPNTALVLANDKEPIEKEKPNFAPSGLLAAASNSVTQADGTSIALKYHEPPEARKPPAKDEWKLFVFKGPDILETIDLSKRSCWLVGREVAVADMPAEHPSVSKQHAVLQFRYIEKKNEFGDKVGRVRPYLIDLESANGTSLNKEEIPPSRYLELRDKDMVQFGHSTRDLRAIDGSNLAEPNSSKH